MAESIVEQLRSAVERKHAAKELALLETNLAAFARAAWPVLEPQTHLVDSWLYDFVSEHLELVSSGELRWRYPDKLGIIINWPPRCAKSFLVSIAWPVWSWLKRPSARFLCSSYSNTISNDHSIKRRSLIQSAWFQQRFGQRFSLRFDRNRQDSFENDQTGYCVATSVGGATLGFGGDFLVGDDLLDSESAYSDAERNATNRWIDGAWSSRRNDPKTGVFIYVSQRLSEEDPTGHLLEQMPGRFIHIKVPLECEADEQYTFPISGRVYHRPAGEILLPDRYPPEEVAGLKQNSYSWSGQYQQRPTATLGGIIKKSWWRFYVRPGDRRPEGCVVLPEHFDQMAQSWDLSFKDTKTSDFVCGGVWGRVRAMKYLLDISWDRMDFPATKKAIISLTARWPEAHAKWIEDAANGPAILSSLKAEISGLIAVKPLGSKEARLHAAAPDVEAGNVVLPHPSIAPWVNRFIDEVGAACRGGRHDDAADMLSQAVNKMRGRPNTSDGFFALIRAQMNSVGMEIDSSLWSNEEGEEIAMKKLAENDRMQREFQRLHDPRPVCYLHGDELRWDDAKDAWVSQTTGVEYAEGEGA